MAQHLTPEDYAEIKKLREEGWFMTKIAKKFGRSKATISDIINGVSECRAAKTERLNKRLTEDEYQNILHLYNQGMRQKDIAAKVGRSTSVVCVALKHMAEMEGGPAVKKRYKDPEPVNSIDLSKLPDTVLFRHTRDFCF